MTDHRPPPPEAEDCLTHSRVSSCKGGTLIAEHVHDLATHMRLLVDRDGYRPEWCARCFGRVLHVHDYPERLPRGELDLPPVIRIVRFICADPACGATWRILPAILARHLWRIWPTVERTTHPAEPPVLDRMPIPERTVRRWRERVASAASFQGEGATTVSPSWGQGSRPDDRAGECLVWGAGSIENSSAPRLAQRDWWRWPATPPWSRSGGGHGPPSCS